MNYKEAVCQTDEFSNFTQYQVYQVIEEESDRIKVIDDDGDVRWISKAFFYIR